MSKYWLFEILPYLTIAIAIAGLLLRFLRPRELPNHSQDGRRGWSRLAWFVGLGGVLLGHLLGLLLPAQVLAWNLSPFRLLLLESSALTFGSLAVVGFVFGGAGRGTGRGIDVIFRTVLVVCLVSGIAIALTERWGSAAYSAIWTPYLWSLLRFSPETARVASLSWIAHLHMATAFLSLALLPFSSIRIFRQRPPARTDAAGWTTVPHSSR